MIPNILERKNFTTTELITGRLLTDRNMLGLRNLKKAASVVEEYIDSNGSPKFSGWDFAKVLSHIFDDMWKMLNAPKNKESESPEEESPVPPPTNKDPKDLTENDEAYYTMCRCYEDQAACGACDWGWHKKQKLAVKKGLGTWSVDSAFTFLGSTKTTASSLSTAHASFAANLNQSLFSSDKEDDEVAVVSKSTCPTD